MSEHSEAVAEAFHEYIQSSVNRVESRALFKESVWNLLTVAVLSLFALVSGAYYAAIVGLLVASSLKCAGWAFKRNKDKRVFDDSYKTVAAAVEAARSLSQELP